MPLVCPACQATALQVEQTLELPPDSRSDEITLQLVVCTVCGYRALASYEESRRGALSDEAVDHRGYRLPNDRLETIAALIGLCPDPGNADCPCASHQELGRRDAGGRWVGVDHEGWFPMQSASGE